MKKIRTLAIAGLMAPLGLLIGACYADPADIEGAPPPTDESASMEATTDEATSEPVSTDSEEIAIGEEEDGVCRVVGSWCRGNWQCCTGNCWYGTCRGYGGGGGYCRPLGSWCRANWQCCTGNCWYGACRGYGGGW